MSTGIGVLLAAMLATAGAARAQETAPSLSGVPSERVSPEVTRDLARLDALIQSHSVEARTTRLALGSVFIATGLAAVPLGIVAETSWQQDYGLGLWVSGAIFLGFGAAA